MTLKQQIVKIFSLLIVPFLQFSSCFWYRWKASRNSSCKQMVAAFAFHWSSL